jgi:epoxyqueuosine reductase
MTVDEERQNPTDASIDRAEASALIKNRARQLGFQRVGIVPAEALNQEAARLQQWLARGFHGEMKWMERDPQQRIDPRHIFPVARSVIVVALNYYTPSQHQVRSAGVTGRDHATPLT